MNRRGFFWLKVGVGALLLAGIIYSVNPQKIFGALKGVRLELVALALILMPVNIGLQEIKWRYLVRLVKPETTFGETWGSLLGGFAFGIVTPGRLGEYGRSLLIRDTPPLKLVGLTVIDKFYNLGCTVAFGLPALLTLPWATGLLGTGYVFIATLGALALLNLVLLYLALDPRPVRSLLYAAQLLLPKGGKIAELAGGLDRFTHRQARTVLVWTLAHYAVFLLQYYILVNGLAQLSFFNASRGAAATLFAKSALPIAIGDLGVDQIVAVQFFGQFGIPAEAAFNASILLFTMNVFLPALIGVLFVGWLPFGNRKPGNP